MKKRIFSILLVVVMTMALVACGSQSTNASAPEATETVSEVVENSETVSESEQATEVDKPESSEATSEPEQATEAPVDEVASTPDSEVVESVPESEASEPETSEPEFTFTELNATKYAIQSVNVRSGPSTDFNKIGSLSTNQEITVNGVCDQTGWFRFDLNGTVAFVSNRYVSDEKVEVALPASNNNESGSTDGTGSAASSNYEKNVWYDMGEYYFIMCNSQEEADYYFGHHYEVSPTLEARYPDRKVYIIGRPNYVTLVAALHPAPNGGPDDWNEITYVPEVGIKQ